MLLDGEPGQRDITRAFELLEEAAQDGLSEAHETLGLQYLLGSYTKTDVTKSVRHLEQAEKLGSVLAASLLYEVYSKAAPGFPPQQLSKAEAYLRKAAGQGYALAQFALALELGHIPEADLLLNLRRDVNEARSWLSLAVKQELGAALYTLAKLQAAHNDVGIPIDAAASKKNLERAIEFGFAPALFQRALWHYREGSIYPQDNVQALRWAVRAGSIGDPGACVFAGELYEKGIGIGNVQPVRLWSGHWMRDEIHPYTHYGLHWYFKALRNGDNKYARERLNLFADKLAAERRLEEEGSKYDHYIPVFERWKSDFPLRTRRRSSMPPLLVTEASQQKPLRMCDCSTALEWSDASEGGVGDWRRRGALGSCASSSETSTSAAPHAFALVPQVCAPAKSECGHSVTSTLSEHFA
jgi:TPR repeat protein